MSPLVNRFLSAVRICAGPLAIKQRLTEAWTEYLDKISPDELPGNLRQDFIELRKAMYTREPLPVETAPHASIRKMSAKEAALHTETIILIYTKLVLQQHAIGTRFKDEQITATNSLRVTESVQTLN